MAFEEGPFLRPTEAKKTPLTKAPFLGKPLSHGGRLKPQHLGEQTPARGKPRAARGVKPGRGLIYMETNIPEGKCGGGPNIEGPPIGGGLLTNNPPWEKGPHQKRPQKKPPTGV